MLFCQTSHVMGSVNVMHSQPFLTQPHGLCECPGPGACSPIGVIVFMFYCYLLNIVNLICQLLLHLNVFTFFDIYSWP